MKTENTYNMSNSSQSFLVADAAKFGTDCAVILNHFRFWLSVNKDNNRNVYDGRVWTHQTGAQLLEQFHYMGSERTINRRVKKLEDAGILLSREYNKEATDRTKWYSINEPFYQSGVRRDRIDDSALLAQNEGFESTELTTRRDRIDDSIRRDRIDDSSIYKDNNQDNNQEDITRAREDSKSLSLFEQKEIQIPPEHLQPLTGPKDLRPFANSAAFLQLMENHFPRIQSLESPFDFAGFKGLVEGYGAAAVFDVLVAMEDWPKLTGRNGKKDAQKTALNWLRRDYKQRRSKADESAVQILNQFNRAENSSTRIIKHEN